MEQNLIVGSITALGALIYNGWCFLEAYNATKDTPAEEKFDWTMSVMTVAPSLVGGFLAGYALAPTQTIHYVGLLTMGYTAGDVGKKLGINSFFRVKKPVKKK